VVAVPPKESARLLGEEPCELEDSPIVSVHLWFDRKVLTTPLAALLGSDAHWVFDRGALTGHEPERGQYLTVVSSGVQELLEVRGRELVERIAGELTERLGHAELLWSRVSREPYATIALRPGVERPAVETRRPGAARAGAWTDTGWPVTMESAVRSGRTAARFALRNAAARVTA
ncbi:MAG: hydroxysqualene dehydroxylase, partial [Gaiellaceae bacterium]|nr:hydroxysqualene dehydroxylase [Gaiellaceae bacterium]